MASKLAEKGGLRQVSDREGELDDMSPEQKVYELAVVDGLNQVADFLKIGEGSAGVLRMVATDGDGFDVEKFCVLLEENACNVFPTLKFRGCKKFAGDLCLRVARMSGCVYFLIVPFAEFADAEVANGYHYKFDGKYYIFKSDNFTSVDKYKGRRYLDVVAMIGEEFGEDSEDVKNIGRVVTLVRSWLYGKETGWHREAIADELVKLRLKVGSAAIAVIADFLRDYEENEGWLDDPGDDEQVGADDYDRLTIGGVNLSSLA